jgi:hypothetical protein
MNATVSRSEQIRATAARMLEHCPYHADRRIDVGTGATSLVQALILAAGGTVRAGRGWASEPTETDAREGLHEIARLLLSRAGVAATPGCCPTKALARWERDVLDPTVIYLLVGAHPEASHHLRVHARAAA